MINCAEPNPASLVSKNPPQGLTRRNLALSTFAAAMLAACGSGSGSSSSSSSSSGGGGGSTSPILTQLNLTNLSASFLSSGYVAPTAITTDGTNLYVLDGHVLRQTVIATGVTTTLAGLAGTLGTSDGVGSLSRFNAPSGICILSGDLYICDTGNHTVRKYTLSTGQVDTIAGIAGSAGYLNHATGTSSQFSSPMGIATDGTDLFIADSNNHRIRRIGIASGTFNVSTYAGSGSQSSAYGSLDTPRGIAYVTESTNYLCVLDDSPSLKYYQAGPNESDAEVADNITPPSGMMGWMATSFMKNTGLIGVTSDSTYVYIADLVEQRIVRLQRYMGGYNAFLRTHLAGSSSSVFSYTDGTSSNARFDTPKGMVQTGGKIYLCDSANACIRVINTTTGATSTLVGRPSGTDGASNAVSINAPYGVCCDGANLYFSCEQSHTIRKTVLATQVTSTLAGQHGVSGQADGTTGATSSFNAPQYLATDGTYVYVADGPNKKIRAITIATGQTQTLAGSGAYGSTDNTLGSSATFALPMGIVKVGQKLYVCDFLQFKIRSVDLSNTNYGVTTIAGNTTTGSNDNTTGTSATFISIRCLTSDGTNYLYVADNSKIRTISLTAPYAVSTLSLSPSFASLGISTIYGLMYDNGYLYTSTAYAVYRITLATGIVNLVTGNATIPGDSAGTGGAVRYTSLRGITTDGTSLFAADNGANKIIQIT